VKIMPHRRPRYIGLDVHRATIAVVPKAYTRFADGLARARRVLAVAVAAGPPACSAIAYRAHSAQLRMRGTDPRPGKIGRRDGAGGHSQHSPTVGGRSLLVVPVADHRAGCVDRDTDLRALPHAGIPALDLPPAPILIPIWLVGLYVIWAATRRRVNAADARRDLEREVAGSGGADLANTSIGRILTAAMYTIDAEIGRRAVGAREVEQHLRAVANTAPRVSETERHVLAGSESWMNVGGGGSRDCRGRPHSPHRSAGDRLLLQTPVGRTSLN
jgi:hypothetical protein